MDEPLRHRWEVVHVTAMLRHGELRDQRHDVVARGFLVDKVFVDGGESAKTITRTEFQKLR
jgi:hypothetical protein